jgi:hypothetical protein
MTERKEKKEIAGQISSGWKTWNNQANKYELINNSFALKTNYQDIANYFYSTFGGTQKSVQKQGYRYVVAGIPRFRAYVNTNNKRITYDGSEKDSNGHWKKTMCTGTTKWVNRTPSPCSYPDCKCKTRYHYQLFLAEFPAQTLEITTQYPLPTEAFSFVSFIEMEFSVIKKSMNSTNHQGESALYEYYVVNVKFTENSLTVLERHPIVPVSNVPVNQVLTTSSNGTSANATAVTIKPSQNKAEYAPEDDWVVVDEPDEGYEVSNSSSDYDDEWVEVEEPF